MKPEILYTRKFKAQFMGCLSRAPVTMRIAVPYVGKIPEFGSIVKLIGFLLGRECTTIQLITRSPGSEPGSIPLHEANLIAQMGVEVMIRNRIHSKIYQFKFREGDRAAFVGSANLSMGGFERNDETMAFFREKADNESVAMELDRIAGVGAFSLEHWKIIGNNTCQQIPPISA